MQLANNAALAAALASSERDIRPSIKVDWNRNGLYDHALSDLSEYVDDIVVDRALKGTAPAELLLVEGSASAELRFRACGEYQGLPFTTVFSPFHPDSPFYGLSLAGCEVIYELVVETALGPVAVPQFVGNVRTVRSDRASGEATVAALDRAEVLRRPVTFPDWAVSSYWESRGRLTAQYAHSDAFLDHLLRWCDVSPSPYRPTLPEETTPGQALPESMGCQFFLPGGGSTIPTIGWVDNSFVQEFPETEVTGTPMYDTAGLVHPSSPEPTHTPRNITALGAEDGEQLKFWAASEADIGSNAQYMGLTVSTSGVNGTYWQTCPDHDVFTVRVDTQLEIGIGIGAGQVWAFLRTLQNAGQVTSSRVNIPTGGVAVPVSVQWSWNTGTSTPTPWVHVTAGASTTGWETLSSVTKASGTDPVLGIVYVWHRVGLSDLYYAHEDFWSGGSQVIPSPLDPTVGRRAARYAAVLDRGQNLLSFVPNTQIRDAWDEAGKIASAEMGSVLWDEAGVFRFWNYSTLATKRDNVAQILTLDDIADLSLEGNLDSVRNYWTVRAERRRAYIDKVYESADTDDFYVPASSVKTFRRPLQQPTLFVDPNILPRHSTLAGSGFPAWGDGVLYGYVVQYLISGTWQESDGQLTPTVDPSRAPNGDLVIEVTNFSSYPLRFVTNAGTAAFRAYGTIVADQGHSISIYMDPDSRDAYGPKNFDLDGDYIHDSSIVAPIVSDLFPLWLKPTPTTDQITAVGDPRRQLADTVRILDPDGLGPEIDVQIYEIQRSFSRDEGLRDTLTVQVVRPGGGIWNDATYGVWGESFVWS